MSTRDGSSHDEGVHRAAARRFIDRLNKAITRSPLLKVPTTRSSRHLDVAKLDVLGPGVGADVVDALVGGRSAALQFDAARITDLLVGTDGNEDDESTPADRRRKRERSLASQVEVMRREAELARRETGVHALWLGYPLVYVPPPDETDRAGLLAPVFLFPVEVRPDARRQGRVVLASKDQTPARFNTAMAAWVERMHGVRLEAPGADDLEGLRAQGVDELIEAIATAFTPPPTWMRRATLREAPDVRHLEDSRRTQLFAAGVIGLFRWQNEAILRDLAVVAETPTCPACVRAVVGGEPAREERVIEPPETDRYLVTDADFSQMGVVWKARAGQGLVVHGPPGTGKSQTIVNLIADALAHGQRVLMVCQKDAATRVVHERLKKAGLGELCIEMHDPEAERTPLFKEIREQAAQVALPTRRDREEERERLARRIEELEREIDAFAGAMHTPHPRHRWPYRRLLAEEGRLLREFPTARSLSELVRLGAGIEGAAAEPMLDAAERAGRAFAESAYLENPWRERTAGGAGGSPTMQRDARDVLSRAMSLDEAHQSAVRQAREGAREGEIPSSSSEFEQGQGPVLQALSAFEGLGSTDRAMAADWLGILQSPAGAVRDGAIDRMRRTAAALEGLQRVPVDPAWEAALRGASALDEAAAGAAAEVVRRMEGRWWRAASGSFRSSVRTIRRLRPDALGENVFAAARSAEVALTRRAWEREVVESARTLLPGHTYAKEDLAGAEAHARKLVQAAAVAEALNQAECAWPWCRPVVRRVISAGAPAGLAAELLNDLARRVKAAEPLLSCLGELGRWFPGEVVDSMRSGVLAGHRQEATIRRMIDGLGRLDALRAFEALTREGDAAVRETVSALTMYEQRAAADPEARPVHARPGTPEVWGRWWRALAGLSIYEAWRSDYWREHPVLERMSGRDQEHLATELRSALRAKRALEADAICNRWRQRQAAVAREPWEVYFKLKGGKNGPAKRMREAVHLSVDRGLLDLRPVWLTNPGAAAQVFPLKEGLFDVVIFDEASQCPVEQALPIVWRAGRVVVAGDEKQLPPTSFFSATSEDEGEEADEEATDKPVSASQIISRHVGESTDLLSAAVASLPQDYLRVHYRSEHPALIEFSNRAFYGGNLEAPPSRIPLSEDGACSGAEDRWRPIEFVAVDGLYEPGAAKRVNRREADEVVRAVRRALLEDPRRPTVGVVTFNRPQRDLVEDLLEVERRRDAEFGAAYERALARVEDNQDVGLFIKNLENVQGDERDVMIFSTTFGRDAQGRFARRFGPVGAEDGYRRLNVAVTRAKQRIVVVSSMPITEVAQALSGEGAGAGITPAGYLQLYLEYAQAVSSGNEARLQRVLDRLMRPGAAGSVGSAESVLEEEVLGVIRAMGFAADSQIGVGGFRIDIGVRHPEPGRGYVLGIECDGAAYHSSRSARLRDVWRQDILTGRYGWKIHRVWSTRWWSYPEEESARLREAIERAVGG